MPVSSIFDIRYFPEMEKTYAFSTNDVEKILVSVQPKSGIMIIGKKCYKLFQKKHLTSIHFFGQSKDKSVRNRLKFIFKDGKIKVRLSPKIFGSSTTSRLEGRWIKDINIDTAFSEIVAFGPIIGSFLKERVKFCYVSKEGELDISVDRMISFDPVSHEHHSQPFYHLEIESDELSDIEEFCSSDYFQVHLTPLLRKVEWNETKWQQSINYNQEDYYFKFSTPSEIDTYLRSLRQSIFIGTNRHHELRSFGRNTKNERDYFEHELKFKIDKNINHADILEKCFAPFGDVFGTHQHDWGEETYLDSSSYCLANKGASLRLRRTKKGNYNLFFKYPRKGDKGIFIRREVKSKVVFSKGHLSILSCLAGKHVIMFIEEHGQLLELENIESIFYVRKKRSVYGLADEYGGIGGILFDHAAYIDIKTPSNRADCYELEFELNERRCCQKQLDIFYQIRENLIEFGLSPSDGDKYQQGLKALKIANTFL